MTTDILGQQKEHNILEQEVAVDTKAECDKRTVETHSLSFPNHYYHDCSRDGQNWRVVENYGGDTVCIIDIGTEAIVQGCKRENTGGQAIWKDHKFLGGTQT